MPLISVVISLFNRVDFIEETLNSVLNQTFSDWECIIVDDGSTDGSFEFVQKNYVEKDSRFRLFRRPDNRQKGACACRNIGMEMAQGKYLSFLDSDDLLAYNKFEVQYNILENNDEKTFVFSPCDNISADGSFIKRIRRNFFKDYDSSLEFYLDYQKGNTMLVIHSWMASRSLVLSVSRWDENQVLFDDPTFLCPVVLACSKIRFSSETKVYYRWGDQRDRASRWACMASSDKYCQSILKYYDSVYQHLLAIEDSPKVRDILAWICIRQSSILYKHDAYATILELKKRYINLQTSGKNIVSPFFYPWVRLFGLWNIFWLSNMIRRRIPYLVKRFLRCRFKK